MGLHQYIREQAHRDDVVGELARKILDDPNSMPSPKHPGFRFAVQEYQAYPWTREEALRKIQANQQAMSIVVVAPRFNDLITEILAVQNGPDYVFFYTYDHFKTRIFDLARSLTDEERQALAAAGVDWRDVFEIFRKLMEKALPPDVADLYPPHASAPPEVVFGRGME